MLYNPRKEPIKMEYDGRAIIVEPGKRYECDAAQETFLYNEYRAYGIIQLSIDEWDDPAIKIGKQVAGIKEAVNQAHAILKSHELRNQAEEATQKFKNSVTPVHITDALQDIQDLKKELTAMEETFNKAKKSLKDKEPKEPAAGEPKE